jgi:hypothetical protein
MAVFFNFNCKGFFPRKRDIAKLLRVPLGVSQRDVNKCRRSGYFIFYAVRYGPAKAPVITRTRLKDED